MTTYALKTTFTLFIFTVLLACNKEEALLEKPITENPKSENNISGAVLLPAGSAIDVNSLTIASPIDLATVTNGTYQMTTIENTFLTLMVTDPNGEVVLMGYTYPGQTDFEINSTSTVLAILMNMPTSLVLAKEAKRELIRLFLDDSNFKQVVNDFEKTLLEGINPLDTLNTSFASAIEVFYRQLLFPQANKSAKLDYSFDPVDVRVTNNKITFANLGKTYETVIGIYKDDVKIENINVERITFIPTTVGDAIGAFASAYGGTELSSSLQPVEYTYTFENEGQYEVKIRTSKLVDDAIENDIALLNNITNWGVDLVLEILPLGDCVQPIVADFKQHAQTFGSFPDATTEQEKLGLLYDVMYTFFNQTKTLITCLGSAEELEDYLKKFGTVLKFIDLVGKIGNGGNILLGITQLVADEGKMDLCYNVAEGVASECGKEYLVSDFAGSIRGFADGLGTSAQFYNIFDINLDSFGEIFVADGGSEYLRKVKADGYVTTIPIDIQNKGFKSVLKSAPHSVDVGNDNTKYLLINNNLKRLGGVTAIASFDSAPNRVVVGDNGNIYVSFHNQVYKVTSGGVKTVLAGGGGGYKDGVGQNTQFRNPFGLAIDADGNILVADTYNHKIRKITPSGVVSTIAGSSKGDADGYGIEARFNLPYGLAIDKDGVIYVADKDNHKIKKITNDGQVITIAGSTFGYANGLGSNAKFNSPNTIAVDADNNIYVGDGGNFRIRKITQK